VRNARGPAGGSPIETAVAEALRAWRLAEARRQGIAPFIILHDQTLAAIAATLPRSTPALGAVAGIGPGKLAKYGDAILTVVSSSAAEPTRSR
jgi:ATP-dependent DNA helicase RecQ